MVDRLSEDDEARRREVGTAVLAYLHQRPQAADTLEGIVGWWLPKQRYDIDRRRIQRVLGELIARGELRCDRLPDGAVLYALNRSTKPPSH
jgi:hypothetical protein